MSRNTAAGRDATPPSPRPLPSATAPAAHPGGDAAALRSIILVGMPGSGKSSIGRRLAARLGLPFLDADTEIEAAAGLPITEIFSRYGEAHFRDGERRVIARLVAGPPVVLATGGGAFADAAHPRGAAARRRGDGLAEVLPRHPAPPRRRARAPADVPRNAIRPPCSTA